MASVYKRVTTTGYNVRMRFRKVGISTFYLTFDDWDAAVQYAEKHEQLYYANPGKYHKDIALKKLELKRAKIWKQDNIIYGRRSRTDLD